MWRLSAALAFALLIAPAARAQAVFRWVDAEGEVHYTDDAASIPKDRRKAATRTEGAEVGIVPSRHGPPAGEGPAEDSEEARAAAQARQERKDAEEREDAAREAEAEKAWRERFAQARAQVEFWEREVKAEREASEDPSSAGIPVQSPDRAGVIWPNPEVERACARLKEAEAQLAKAREALADLEREAARKAIPLTWRR